MRCRVCQIPDKEQSGNDSYCLTDGNRGLALLPEQPVVHMPTICQNPFEEIHW